MKTIISLLTLLTICTHGMGQEVTIADSIEISNKIDDWNKGWKMKDYKIATKWYSVNAEFTNAFGHNRIGRSEIENLINSVFQLPFVMAGDSKVTEQKFIPLNERIVLVVTSIERTGQKLADERELGIRHTTHHRIFRKDNEWLIVGHLISDARSTSTTKH